MRNNIGIIIHREFAERVAKKSFIITTLLMPVLMLLMMTAPALIMAFSSPSDKHLAVIDESGVMFSPIEEGTKDIEYLTVNQVKAPLDSVIADRGYDGVLFIGADVVENPRNAFLYLHDAGGIEVENTINNILKQKIEDTRLRAYNIENLQQIMAEVEADVHVSTIRIDDDGEEESTSSSISMLIGMAMTLYVPAYVRPDGHDLDN